MEDLSGQNLGQYRIIEPIGQGGMASVFKAYQPSLDRYVAVKVLPPYYAHEAGFTARFEREARAVAQLNHHHILPIYDYGQEGNYSYIVMQYVEGGTLKDALKGTIPPEDIARYIDEISSALDYAHSIGILHRDVKPSNVLIDHKRKNWSLLTDFGLARMVEGTSHLTGSGVGVGTPQYISPEQGQGKEVDHRTDIYSLGVVLYEMVTGNVPFDAETPLATVLKHVTDPLPLPSTVNPGVPANVERVVLKAMAKTPADRYDSAGEMAKALKDAMSSDTITMPPPTRTTKKIAVEMPTSQQPPAKITPVPTTSPGYATSPPLAQPRKGGSSWAWIIGLLAVAIVGVIIVALMVGGFLALRARAIARQEATATAQARATATVIARATGTAEAEATATQEVFATATAMAKAIATTRAEGTAEARAAATAEARAAATAEARAAATAEARGVELTADVDTLIASSMTGSPIFGPDSGSLPHDDDTFVEEKDTNLSVRDFVAQATFYTPYSTSNGSWDFGLLFRRTEVDYEYRLAIDSDGGWGLRNRNGADSDNVDDGQLTNLLTEPGTANYLMLVANGDKGYFFLNDEFITELDLSDRDDRGTVVLATGIYSGDEIPGESTDYDDFTVWSVSAGETLPEQLLAKAKSKPPVFGPTSGSLAHDDDGYIEEKDSGVYISDFVTEVTFYNPYPRSKGKWDFGYLFRDTGGDDQFRLIIGSDGGWALCDRQGTDETFISTGKLSNLDTDTGGYNKVTLIAFGEYGYFFLNDVFIAELSLSTRTKPGDVTAATAIYSGDEIAGESTDFVDFTVWSLE